MIHITVNSRTLTAVTDERLVAKTVGVVNFEVSFSEDWDALEKTIVFSGKGGTKPVLDPEGETEVPWEPLDRPGYLYISAVGRAEGQRDVTALMSQPLWIERNGDIGEDPAQLPPSPTELEQAVLACAKSAREARDAAEKSQALVGESKINSDLAAGYAQNAGAGALAAERSRVAAEEAENNARFSAGQAQEEAVAALVSREGAEEAAGRSEGAAGVSGKKALEAEEQAKKAAQEREAAAREALDAGQARAGAEQALEETRTAGEQLVQDAGKIVGSVRPDIDLLYAALIRDSMTGPIVQGEFVPGTTLDYRIDIEATQEGEGEPSPENVMAISGVDAVSATVCGKNLCGLVDTKIALGLTFAYENGFYHVTGKSTQKYNSIGKRAVLKKGSYTASGGVNSGNSLYFQVNYTDENNKNYYVSNRSFTLNQDTEVYMIVTSGNWTGDVDCYVKPQLELGTVATEYEPYRGVVLIISLPETSYGGYIDYKRGKYVKTFNCVRLDGNSKIIEMLTHPSGQEYANFEKVARVKDANLSFDWKCDRFTPKAYAYANLNAGAYKICFSSGKEQIHLTLPAGKFKNKDELSVWLAENPANFVYPLESPIEYDLPDLPQLTALEGITTLFSDAARVSVTGYMDTKSYIDKKLIELTALKLEG